MGIKPEHHGLGGAVAFAVEEQIRKRGANVIMALSQEGRLSKAYGRSILESVNEYVVLEKALSENIQT
jgi:hypothetical protein